MNVYPELQVAHLLKSVETQVIQLLTLHDTTFKVTGTL